MLRFSVLCHPRHVDICFGEQAEFCCCCVTLYFVTSHHDLVVVVHLGRDRLLFHRSLAVRFVHFSVSDFVVLTRMKFVANCQTLFRSEA